MKSVLKRLSKYQEIKAKVIQNFPKIIVEPQPSDIIRMVQQNGESCRGIISETDGLIIFDSSQYTHAGVTSVLEEEHHIDLPPKLDPAHQITIVSTKALDFNKIYIFTSIRAFKNPIDELKKYSKVYKKIEHFLKPVYVPYDKYDDARYYLSTIKDKNELIKELRSVLG